MGEINHFNSIFHSSYKILVFLGKNKIIKLIYGYLIFKSKHILALKIQIYCNYATKEYIKSFSLNKEKNLRNYQFCF